MTNGSTLTPNTIAGKVGEINIGGHGPGSGQLEFSIIREAAPGITLAVEMDTEGRVVSGMITLLTAAYFHGRAVAVEYYVENNQALNVKLPAD